MGFRMSNRNRCLTPSPLWGEGWGEGVLSQSLRRKRGNPLTLPSPPRGEGK